MKRIIYSAVVLLALGVVSCAKQDIQPTGAANDVPVWRGSTTNINTDVDPNGGGKITDPNNDPESSSPVGDDN